jgi:hypothetical protein
VLIYLDHSAPVALIRERLHTIVQEIPAWDGRAWGLDVTDTTPSTLVVRALVTAKDAGDVWKVRCAVREKLVEWISAEHPYALPRVPPMEDEPSPASGNPAASDPAPTSTAP